MPFSFATNLHATASSSFRAFTSSSLPKMVFSLSPIKKNLTSSNQLYFDALDPKRMPVFITSILGLAKIITTFDLLIVFPPYDKFQNEFRNLF